MKLFCNILFFISMFSSPVYGMNIELKIQADSEARALPPAIAEDFKDKRIVRDFQNPQSKTRAVAAEDRIRMYDQNHIFVLEILACKLRDDLDFVDMALSLDDQRLFILGLATGSAAKILYIVDIHDQKFVLKSERKVDEHGTAISGKSERYRLLLLDGKNILLYNEDYIELWYLDNNFEQDFQRKVIFSSLDFPSNTLPGNVKKTVDRNSDILIQTVLFINQAVQIFYYNRSAMSYAVTTITLERSKTSGLETVYKVDTRKERLLRWASEYGNQFATAQLVAAAGKLFIYCDDIFYDVEDGRSMSADFTRTHRNIIGRQSYAPEKRIEESTERKPEVSNSEALLTPNKNSSRYKSDKENSKKAANSYAEFLRMHKKKIIAGAVGACVIIVACVLGFKYAKRKRLKSFSLQPLSLLTVITIDD